MRGHLDITGNRYGRLVAVEIAVHGKDTKDGNTIWRCRCDCGSVVVVRGNTLRSRAKSCGCQKREAATKHGETAGPKRMKRPPEYNTWQSMKQRCLYPKHVYFHRYGGRGITIHPEWAASFEKFLAYIGRRPGPGYSLDRIDNDGNYEPGNVRWATKVQQAANRAQNSGRKPRGDAR